MAKVKIGVLVSGSGSNLQSVIDNIKAGTIGNAEIAVVLSNKKSALGLERARQNDIPAVFVSKKEAGSLANFNQIIIDTLAKYGVELVVLAGYLSILTPEFIAAFENRIINIHPSLLPSFGGKGYYGLNVHQAALDYGVKLSGATVHFVDNGTDTGPVILQESVAVEANDTAEILQQRVLKIEHSLLPKALDHYCNGRLNLSKNQAGRTIVEIG